MISYNNIEIKYNGCPACAYAKGEFSLPCGLAYEDEFFTISQDWELPIEGFMVISPKRYIERLCELTEEENKEMMNLLNKTMRILRENQICDEYNVIFYEKPNIHFHVWIMPRYKWMYDLVGSNILYNMGPIISYAKTNLRKEEVYQRIKEITEIIKKNM